MRHHRTGNRGLRLAVPLGLAAFLAVTGCEKTGDGGSTNGSGSETSSSEVAVAPRTSTTPATAAPAEAQPAPPVQITPAVLNFGTLRPNEEVTGTVELKNVGDRPLRILTTRASCNCTSVDLANVIIEPGESVPLEAKFESGDTLGERSAAVRVLFEGGYRLLEVDIRAKVTLPVQASPAHIDAQEVLVGTVTVSSVDGQPFRILGVNGNPPPFVGFDPKTGSPRNTYELQWDLTSFNPQTCLNQYGEKMPEFWAIETDHPDCGVFDVQIRHQCTRPAIPRDGRHWVLPGSRALIGDLRPGQIGSFDIDLVWIHRAPPDDMIYEVTSSNPEQFEAELVETKRIGDEITCRVSITPNPDHRGLIYGTVMFHSARHSAPYLIIGRVSE